MKNFAMVFPGQGSQEVGMLAELASQFPIIEETFRQASGVLGYDLWQLVQQGPAEELNKTWHTQPALLTASVALFRLWQQQFPDVRPSMMAGHSLGEYSALVCADVVDFQDAVKLVALRGKLMQEAVPENTGAMYAIIGLDNESIIQACQQASQGEVVSAVNFNSPGQVVIAGQKSAVERAGALCKEAGAKRALPLAVSVPSHCELMRSASEKFAESLAQIPFHTPTVAILNNVDVEAYTDPNQIRDALIRQLHSPVRWTEIVEKMASNGAEVLLEMGANKVLTGLIKRIDKSLEAQAVNDQISLDTAYKSLFV